MKEDRRFYWVNYYSEEKVDPSLLLNRPYANHMNSLETDAHLFVPGDDLELAINTAITIGEPLLLTGEPGTGKTQSAYYTAYKLGTGPVLHYQVKSDSRATDLLYYFDTVRYFHDATVNSRINPASTHLLNKANYLEQRILWKAFESSVPQVVLIDEIDKAPRDFPNDLLYELDQMQFTVAETGEKVEPKEGRSPIVFITSNGERRLPEPFLRRCVYHHINFDESLVRLIVRGRSQEYNKLSTEFVDFAVRRFMALRELPLRKHPSTSELLVWLRVLSITTTSGQDGKMIDRLNGSLSELPYLNLLLKDKEDYEDLK